MNIYQSNTYRKDLSQEWAKGSREAAIEGSVVLYIRFCSLFNNSN